MEKIASQLQHHAFFSPLSGRVLNSLARECEVLRVSKGARLYTQNAPADCAFLVLNGSVDLVEETGRIDALTHFVGTGVVLSHLALLTQTTRLTSAYARTNLEVAKITRASFTRALKDDPAGARGVQAHLVSLLEISEQERRQMIADLERMVG